MQDIEYKEKLILLANIHPDIVPNDFFKEKHNSKEFVKIIKSALVEHKHTMETMRIFKTILPYLLSELIGNASTNPTLHNKVTLALAKIVVIHPTYIDYVFRHFENKAPLLDQIKPNGKSNDNLEIIRIAYQFLSVAPLEFSRKWNWSILFELLTSSDKETSWYASRCLSLLLKTENIPNKLTLHDQYTKILSELDQKHFLNQMMMKESGSTIGDSPNSSCVNVTDVILTRRGAPTESRLIYTKQTKENMRSLATAVNQGNFILLEGVTGSGKSVYVEELARLTGNNDIIKVHLDESFDSKDLLGTYICTDVPGEFVWQPGALVKAMTEGRWILIEDIDLASFDVISSLIPLVESNTLYLSSRDELIYAKSGFKLFSTQGLVDTFSGVPRRQKTIPMLNLWTSVNVKSLPIEEIKIVLEEKFKPIKNIIPKFIETFQRLVFKEEEEGSENKELVQYKFFGRSFSIRDLIKWCERVSTLYGSKMKGNYIITDLKEDIFNEARDVFCGMIIKKPVYEQIVQILSHVWEITEDRVGFFHDYYKPNLQDSKGNLTIGRVNMIREQKEQTQNLSKKFNFAHTKHALRLLERIAVGVQMNEPILLTGETGTGKTSVVQYLSILLGHKLVVHNLNQQTDSADFIGGYKPVDLKILASALKANFEKLFGFSFSVQSNEKFIGQIRTFYNNKDWDKFISLLEKGIEKAKKKFEQAPEDRDTNPKKSKQTKSENTEILKKYWTNFEDAFEKFSRQHHLVKNSFAFSFVEGSLVTALREGHWILLDEINLASTETLERLSGLLEGKDGTLFITEKGDTEPIKRHPNFRMFACMNPPTDIGKKDLPPSLKSRFTEFYVHELEDRDDLKIVVRRYLEGQISDPPVDDVVNFFIEAKKQAESNLSDGSNQRPAYSLRTLCRALEYTNLVLHTYGVERSLYEGLCMSFLTQLNAISIPIMERMIAKFILKKTHQNELNSVPKCPGKEFVQFEHFWIRKGQFAIEEAKNFIQTPSVKENLKNLARIIVSYKYPILLQGPTSAGKTSMVKYLANRTGHRFVRINNHETTDLQEYFGTYITNSEGKLVFKEGILVEAVRNGYWIVLDELNLAPSDILEGLNRLLDDNRELFIPETQEVIKPHPHFQLFATQNPPGLYGGRKVLSRAFRNRFMELQVDDIPGDELIEILQKRCDIPKSFATNMVSVMKDLQSQRQKSQIFAGKAGFITPRDLFRWAERLKNIEFTKKDLAEIGYMLLAERLRHEDEKNVVKESLEVNILGKPKGKQGSEFKSIDVTKLYDFKNEKEFKELNTYLQGCTENFSNIVWSGTMKRIFALVGHCIRNKEPCLLIGESGTGKTTVCQLYSLIRKQHLHILNCHQHTETSDFLGSLRPVRSREQLAETISDAIKEIKSKIKKMDKKFEFSNLSDFHIVLQEMFPFHQDPVLHPLIESLNSLVQEHHSLFHWYDGPLVTSMKKGDMFLVDEISLADDAVLERLNSVLEPERTLVLPEKGSESIEETVAVDTFRILATMNPGGDFGKRELSPALRNRFTEIYVPALSLDEDLHAIISEKLSKTNKKFTQQVLNFVKFFASLKTKKPITVRDIISWIEFLNLSVSKMSEWEAYLHGAQTIFLDGLGVGMDASEKTRLALRQKSLEYLMGQIPDKDRNDIVSRINHLEPMKQSKDVFGFAPFFIPRGSLPIPKQLHYSMTAPTTNLNIVKVLRAMQLPKPILLEGSPGVGKTSLILALAKAAGQNVVRINLSDQTDMMDLLGSDLPVEGSSAGEFKWSDGIFLRALKAGDWVLLDELNLASQSVLEGLNSVLDHRSEIFIPELNKTFACPQNFRIFASQNPLQQGGGRKGLPKSFLNRFTKVYVDELKTEDLHFISISMYPKIGEENLKKMIQFNQQIHHKTMVEHAFGRKGAPWEFNLRDVFRWCEMMTSDDESQGMEPSRYVDTIYRQRMRSEIDKTAVENLYETIFGNKLVLNLNPNYNFTESHIQIGSSLLKKEFVNMSDTPRKLLVLLHHFLNPLENIIKCVEMNYMVILTGPSSSGKSSIVRLLAQLTENDLNEFSMSASTDTVELLGGFEQVDPSHKRKMLSKLLQGEMFLLARSCVQNHQAIQSLKEIYNEWYLSTLDTSTKPEFEQGKVQFLFNFATKLYATAETLKVKLHYTLDDIVHQVEIIENLISNGIKGRFEWKDGIIIRSMELGHWVLVDNVNFCSPTVLDRLNSLLEPGGVLVVNERGTVDGEVKIVKPHKNFRIFMLMDPKYGEISRSMRNRGIEISLSAIPIPSQDANTLLSQCGVSSEMSHFLVNYHVGFINTIRMNEDEKPSLRDLLLAAKLMVREAKERRTVMDALKFALDYVYITNRILSLKEKQVAMDLLISTLNIPYVAEFPDSLVLGSTFNSNAFDFNTMMRNSAYLHHTAIQSMRNQFLSRNVTKVEMNNVLETKSTLLTLPDAYSSLFQGSITKINKQAESKDLKSLFDIASMYFVQNASFQDLTLRTHFVTILKHQFSKDAVSSTAFDKICFVLENVSKTSVFAQLKQLRSNLLESVPIDIRSNASMLAKYQPILTSKDLFLMEKFVLILSRLFVKFDEAHYYHVKKQESFVEDKMSLLHKSFWYFNHPDQRLRVANNQKILFLFYPLFTELDKSIESTFESKSENINLEAVARLCEARDRLWDYLTHELELKEQVLIYWNKLSKSLPNANHVVSQIDDALNSLYPNAHTKNTLWKRGGKPNSMSSTELTASKDAIIDFANNNKLIGKNDINNLMLKGMATIMWMNNKGDAIDANHLTPLIQLPKQLEEKNQIVIPRKKMEEQVLEDMFASITGKKPKQFDAQQDLYALFDHKSMLFEMNILSLVNEANLQYLQQVTPDPKFLKEINDKTQFLMEYISNYCSRSILDVTPYQVMSWKLVEDKLDQKSTGNLLQEMFMNWNQRLWNNSFNKFSSSSSSEMSTLDGPPRLFQDVKAIRILQLLSEWNKIPIRQKFTKIEQMEKIRDFLSTNHIVPSPEESDWRSIMSIFASTLLHFQPSWQDAVFKNLLSLIASMLEFDKHNVENIVKSLNHCIMESNDARLKNCANDLCFIAQSLMSKAQDKIIHYGQLWTMIGVIRMNLTVPAQALDPTLKYKIEFEFLTKELSKLEEKKKIITSIQQFTTGATQNHQLTQIEQEITKLKLDLSKAESKLVLRPESLDFLEVYRTLQLFLSSYGEKSKMKHMMDLLMKSDKVIITQEEIWQENTTNLLHKIQNMKGYEDITTPFITCAYQIKYGLRLLAYGSINSASSETHIHDLIQLLLTFPGTNSVENISKICTYVQRLLNEMTRELVEYNKFDMIIKICKTLLSKAYLNAKLNGFNKNNLECLDSVFTIYSEMWKVVSEEIEKKRIEKENLYKYKAQTTEILSDEQIIENEIRDMFPSYDQEYFDLLDQFEKDKMTLKKEQKSDVERIEKVLSSPQGLEFLTGIHQDLFSNRDGKPNMNAIRSDIFDDSFAAAKLLMSRVKKPYTFTDSDTLPLLMNTSVSLAKLKEKIDVKVMKPVEDFYMDENIAELSIAFTIVSAMVVRCHKLLEKYEDDGNLINMIQIGEKILTMELDSPLAKIINGLELLLKKAFEWEQQLTSQAGMIRTETANLSALIIRWRKNELANWKNVFVTKNRMIASRSYPYWFKFYRIIHLGEYTNMETASKEFFNLVDDFLRSTNFGEFKPRLDIISSLCDQVILENELGYERKNTKEFRENLINILFNVYKFYAQFLPIVETTIQNEIKPLQDKLIDFVKLAKWNDTNISGIQQATERARKKLAKFSTAYTHILYRPARDLWDKENPFEAYKPEKRAEKRQVVEEIDVHALVQTVRVTKAKPKEIEGSKILQDMFCKSSDSNLLHENSVKLANAIHNIVKKYILEGEGLKYSNQGINTIEELSTTIIVRTIELKKSEKVNQKQRALTDLLLELGELGISHLSKGIKEHTKIENVMMQPKVTLIDNDIWKKAEEYFFKDVLLLQKLKFAARDYHINVQKEVTKMMGYAENLFVLLMKQRKWMNFVNQQVAHLSTSISTLNVKSSDSKTIGIIPPQNLLSSWKLKIMTHLSEFLEVLEEFGILVGATLNRNVKLDQEIKHLNTLKSIMDSIKGRLYSNLDFETFENVCKQLNKIGTEVEVIVSRVNIPNVCQNLVRCTKEAQSLTSLFHNDQHHIIAKNSSTMTNHDAFVNQFVDIYNQIVFRIKISIQNLKEKNEGLAGQDEKENLISNLKNHYLQSFKFIKLQELNDLIQKMIQCIIDFSNQDVYTDSKKSILNHCVSLIKNLTPHMESLVSVIQIYLIPFGHLFKSLSKLEFILLNTFTTLFREGFCIKEAEEEQGGEGEIQFTEGTGMDEGEGIEDVSKEIENEDQIMNEKDEKPQEGDQKDLSENKDEGIEMENDFNGEYYDDEEKEEDKKDQNEEEEGDELDDEMGQVDDEDQEILDQKLWEDEQEEKSNDREEQSTGNDNKMEEESEIKGKDEEEEEGDDSNPKEDKKKKKPLEYEEDIEQEADEEEEEVNQGDFQDNMPGDDQGDQEDTFDDQLNLPEELNIEDEGVEEEEGEEGEDENKEGDEEEDEEDQAATNPENKADQAEGDQDVQTEELGMQHEDEEEGEEDENEEDQEDEDQEDEKSAGHDNAIEEHAKEDEEGDEKGENPEEEEEDDEENDEDKLKESAFEEDLKETPFGIKESIGKPSEIKEDSEEKQEDTSLNPDEEAGKDTNKQESGASFEKGSKQKQQDPKAHQNKFDPNPERDLGDALKEWKEKLNMIDSKDDKKSKDELIEEDEEGGDEHEFGDNKNDDQTKGPATEEQSKEFPPLEQQEEEEEEEDVMDEEEQGKDLHDDFETEAKTESTQKTQEKKPDDEKPNLSEKPYKEAKDQVKQETKQESEQVGKTSSTIHTQTQEKLVESQEVIPVELTADEITRLRQELEETLSKWRENVENVDKAKEVWKQFDMMTSSLSQELCEQLRLILEPTLATKMKGDYKSGKRINMKKVITYIASQFRKDKIWLRRTKPNKRQYQVLVAIDDSKSMSKNNAGGIACEAVVLLCKALSQLEVGELGVLKFGESVQMLHAFDQPFSDEAGAEILAQFTFDQKQTQMAQFLNYAVQMMEIYKNMSSFRQSTEQVQLTFIISDGRLLERENIVKIVREANQKRQLLCFILIDSQNDKESILDLKTITYPNNILTIQSYIDQFPFPYYIILKDTQSLPEILADALRQWFELINMVQE